MNTMRDGKLALLPDLRKGDHLQNFFATFKEMYDALRNDRETETQHLIQLSQKLHKTNTLSASNATIEELLAELDSVIQAKQKSLEG